MSKSYLFVIHPPKIWSWKAHSGYGRYSFNPLQKEREFVQYHLKKQFDEDLLACPLRISYDFMFEIPVSYSKKKKKMIGDGELLHITTPDCSNVTKFFEDCLKGIVIEDDKYVVESRAIKFYGDRPQVVIRIDCL